MLRHTWDRARRIVSCQRIVTVITAGQERHLDEETAQGVPGRVLVQPANKETAPGLLLPLLWIAERDPSATVVVFPADHFIWEEGRFLEHVMAAVSATHVLADKLVILGVEADGPEQGYGWIGAAHPVTTLPSVELYGVHSFWEKPDRNTASRLYDQGYLWNTLVLIGRVDAFLHLMEESVPELMRPLQDAVGHLDGPKGSGALVRAYQRIRPTNLSHELLARRSDALAVLAARHVYWSDWGDPHRVLRALIRFDRRPSWLPAYARALTQGADVL
jgi:mannose-1-phosphate guanylyltransferase